MIARMEAAGKGPRDQADQASAHSMPYPDRLHAHLSAAADAAASLATADEAGQAPTPTELVERYGGSEGVNTTENEGGEND